MRVHQAHFFTDDPEVVALTESIVVYGAAFQLFDGAFGTCMQIGGMQDITKKLMSVKVAAEQMILQTTQQIYATTEEMNKKMKEDQSSPLTEMRKMQAESNKNSKGWLKSIMTTYRRFWMFSNILKGMQFTNGNFMYFLSFKRR